MMYSDDPCMLEQSDACKTQNVLKVPQGRNTCKTRRYTQACGSRKYQSQAHNLIPAIWDIYMPPSTSDNPTPQTLPETNKESPKH
jgi:hypothetical protein